MSIPPLAQEIGKVIPAIPKSLACVSRSTLRVLEHLPIGSDVEQSFPHLSAPCVYAVGQEELDRVHRPLRVGVIFSGGQAPGGHNVLCGLLKGLEEVDPNVCLLGFLGGPSGLLQNTYIHLTPNFLASYLNTGGFHAIGSGRTKIETPEHFAKVRQTVQTHQLNGLVIIGGDDSNTNACYLADFFQEHHVPCTVVGVPKTIDGDLQSPYVPLSFGFDTASRVYCELLGNVAMDVLSAKKMWAFIKLMGRSASHLTLECGVQVRANMILVAEAVAEQKLSLQQIVTKICDMIEARAHQGKLYGLVVIPEGLIEFIPEIQELIQELNTWLAQVPVEAAIENLPSHLQALFSSLPPLIQDQLVLERDPHGNVQVSKIETERLLMQLCQKELKTRQVPFSPQPFFFGYEARASVPSPFDASYCYSLGKGAAVALAHEAQGVMVGMQEITRSVDHWKPVLVSLTSMMDFEMRKGVKKAVIRKTLVNLQGSLYQTYVHHEKDWALHDHYQSPGPIQFFGPRVCPTPGCFVE